MRIPSLAEQIYRHAARFATPFRSRLGQACASLPRTTFTHQATPVRSASFRQWLASSFFAENGQFPSRRAVLDAIDFLEGEAHSTPAPEQHVDLRVAARGNPHQPEAILLDLADPQGHAVQITSAGWQVITAESAAFRRAGSTRPLPEPRAALPAPHQPGIAAQLAWLLNLAGFPQAHSVIAWLIGALRPAGPYPILVLHGPAASGKTTAARMLRSLLDPSTAPLLPLPASERQLHEFAWNQRILAFDDFTPSPNLADALARLASGTGAILPEPGNAHDPILLTLERPIILTTSQNPLQNRAWAKYPALLDRVLTAELAPMESNHRYTERDMYAEFDSLQPALLAELCTATASALANLASCGLETAPRFADLAQWITAAAPALAIPAHALIAGLSRDSLVKAVAALLRDQTEWTGTATGLLATLRARLVQGLPANGSRLMRKLNRASLFAHGIQVSQHRSACTRTISLTAASPYAVTNAASK